MNISLQHRDHFPRVFVVGRFTENFVVRRHYSISPYDNAEIGSLFFFT